VGEEVEVAINDVGFEPAMIEITVGTTVTWVNEDGIDHTATATDGIFDTGMIDAGESASVTFDDAGTFAYVCDLHPDMEGVVVVVEAD
jgi:plastocyanin